MCVNLNDVINVYFHKGGILGDEVGTVAIICRTNLELFDQAVRICDEATAQKKRTRIGFAGVSSEGTQRTVNIIFTKIRFHKNENICS